MIKKNNTKSNKYKIERREQGERAHRFEWVCHDMEYFTVAREKSLQLEQIRKESLFYLFIYFLNRYTNQNKFKAEMI